MIYDTVSVKQVIAKVLTDNNLHEENHRIADLIEWAGEALEKIGAFVQLDVKVAGKGGEPLLEIDNYQAELPTGLYSIIQAVYTPTSSPHGPYYSMRYGSGSFDSVPKLTIEPAEGSTEDTTDEYLLDTNKSINYVYVIAGNWIKTNVKSGYIMLAYTQIPLDDEGYPKVPNKASFLEALYWYITLKLLYPKWVNGEVREIVYFEARRSWNYYRKQAYGEAMMPEGDQLTSIKHTWNQLIPEVNSEDTFHSTEGQQEIIYNQNVRRWPLLYNLSIRG